jgi:alcohol dehydrogenase
LLEVHAASVNPVDYKIRQGGQRGGIHLTMPAILGLDASGVITAIGSKVTRFKVGDEVYVSPTHRRPGTYAEYTVIDESEAALKPTNLTHAEAASIPLVGLTAWEALVIKGHMKQGDSILIQAGSGGVGSFAIQLAKHVGAYVYTTCSTRNVELVTGLGADRVIDYTKESYLDVIDKVDHVLEALGEPEQTNALQIIKRGGHMAALNGGMPRNTKKYGPILGLLKTGIDIVRFKLKARLGYGVRMSQILRQTRGDLLEQITPLLESGTIRPVLDKTFSLDEIAEAHRYIETGRARGKIAIAVKS